MKKWLLTLFAAICLWMPTTAFAETTTQTAHMDVTEYAVQTSTSAPLHDIRLGSSFRASRSFSSRARYTSRYTSPYRTRSGFGFGSHFLSFFAGYTFARLFNPFGFGYGYGVGFGLFHIIFDIFLIWIIWRIIRRMFR
ncbi:hypothetical protein [Alicyclobacillus fodiniaquatilis]|uniref:Uncharacterized protein n=1 Tax=Alicyclobacillus fodiniaquatilis TaxID=1661150 RepID=A0ABW4JK67_9BACL